MVNQTATNCKIFYHYNMLLMLKISNMTTVKVTRSDSCRVLKVILFIFR